MMLEGRKAVEKLRRVYVPGGPLFAQRPLKFQGKQYTMREPLPVEQMSKAKHLYFFSSGLAAHAPRGPFDKRTEKTFVATVTPGETVHTAVDVVVRTPEQRKRKRAPQSAE